MRGVCRDDGLGERPAPRRGRLRGGDRRGDAGEAGQAGRWRVGPNASGLIGSRRRTMNTWTRDVSAVAPAVAVAAPASPNRGMSSTFRATLVTAPTPVPTAAARS